MRLLRAAAAILTALALIPSGAHLFELPNKLALSGEQYFTVQQIYRGWALFGIVIIAAMLATGALAILLWRRGRPFGLALLACASIAASLVVFFVCVYPGNVATRNWTVMPEDWQTLRSRWEFGHAAEAVLTFIAVCALALCRTGSDDARLPQRRDL